MYTTTLRNDVEIFISLFFVFISERFIKVFVKYLVWIGWTNAVVKIQHECKMRYDTLFIKNINVAPKYLSFSWVIANFK